MKNPLITIGMPTYNQAKYLETAINSVINQTYSNLELVVVDNCSSDSTDKILSNVGDPRVIVLKVSNKGSIAKSRNLILEKASGEWIAFLDSDDWWTYNKIESCADYFKEGIDFIYHNLIKVTGEQNLSHSKSINSRRLQKPIFQDLMINGNCIATSSAVVRTSLLKRVGGMNESKEMIGIEDFNTWLKISRITEGFKFISKNLGYYRIHDTNISQTKMFLPPTAAFIEFTNLLSDKQLRDMNLNYIFVSVRSNLLAGNYLLVQSDLMLLIKAGSALIKLKAIYLMGYSFYKLVSKKFRSFLK
jgi:glycosyltransferase involved in cell wall biosynthesis